MSETVVAPPVRPTTPSAAPTRQLWIDRLARFPASGLTLAPFCALERELPPLLPPGDDAEATHTYAR